MQQGLQQLWRTLIIGLVFWYKLHSRVSFEMLWDLGLNIDDRRFIFRRGAVQFEISKLFRE